MELDILCDVHWESGIDKVVGDFSSPNCRRMFESQDYGTGLGGIVIVLMCRNPSLAFKQRIRFVRRERRLYMDIMFDLDAFRQMGADERRRDVARQLADEVPAILRKYSIVGFDRERFVADWRGWLSRVK
ncbi:MAG: hypothetical protein NTV86_02585 [Planctomycetota bacterium]|nr:hypothetical protein [Planctomycetota bacterium]